MTFFSRGLSKGITAICLCLFALSTAAAFDLDSLLVESVGGEAAFERLRTVENIHATGEIKLNQQAGRFDMWVAVPNKVYLEVDFGPFSLVQAYDGTTAWQRDHNGSITELTGYEKRELLKQAYFQTYSYLFMERIPGGVTYGGLVELDSAMFHQVLFCPLDGDTVYGYFDMATGLQVRSVSYLDNLETITYSDDYRAVEGVMMSFHSLAMAAGASLSSEFILDRVDFDSDMDRDVFTRPGTAVTDFRFPVGSDSVVVPFAYVAGHIYVPATINGRKKVRLILDSGASANIFHAPALAGLDLPRVGSLPAKGVSGYEEVALVRTDSVAIGTLLLYSQVAGSLDLGGIGQSEVAGEPFGGVLGYDFLSRFPLLVNYETQTLTVYDPNDFVPPEEGVEIPFQLTMQIPTVDAQLVGVPGKFIVDLGNAFGLVVHEDFWKSRHLEEKLDDVQPVAGNIGGVGGGVLSRSAYAASFSLGDIRVSSLRILLLESSEGLSGSGELAGNIGNLFMEQFTVLFDYPGQRIVFYPTSEEAN